MAMKTEFGRFQLSENSTAAKLQDDIKTECDDSSKSSFPELFMSDEQEFDEEDRKSNVSELSELKYDDLDENEEKISTDQNLTIQHEAKGLSFSDLEFVKSLKLFVNDETADTYHITFKKIMSGKVKLIQDMNNEEVKKKFNDIVKTIGKYRTFYSVIHDMEMFITKWLKKKKHPKKPIRPMPPHTIYMKELMAMGKKPPANQLNLLWASRMYNKLSVQEKSRYTTKYDQMMKTYCHELKNFYDIYPDQRPCPKNITPFNLFFAELKSKEVNPSKALATKQWKKLAVNQKVIYINKARQYEVNGATKNMNVRINNKEKMLLAQYYGKPEKPPASVYHLHRINQESSDEPDAQKTFKYLSMEEKERLYNRLNDMVQDYKRNMNEYIENLPDDAKEIELKELSIFLSKYKLRPTSLKKSIKRDISDVPDNTEEEIQNKRRKKQSKSHTTKNSDVKVRPRSKRNKSTVENVQEQEDSKVVKNEPERNLLNNKSPQIHTVLENISIKTENDENIGSPPKEIREEFDQTKPPKTLFKYFVSINMFESLDKAKKIYRNLPKLEKKTLKKSYNVTCESYIIELRKYLTSLEESEMNQFIKKMEQEKIDGGDNTDEDITSSEDDSCPSDNSSDTE